MKLNIACKDTGQQKLIEVDDEKKLIPFIDRRIGQEVSADSLGEEFSGYVFKIRGGNDKQGFPMRQGILVPHRVRLLMKKGMKGYRPRRKGERKRKSIRGCVVGHDLSVLSVMIAQKGDNDIPGLTDEPKPNRLGPKRAMRICKMFGKNYKNPDAVKLRVRRQIEGHKNRFKSPKVQRLVTDRRIKRKQNAIHKNNEAIVRTQRLTKEYARTVSEWRAQLATDKAKDAAKKKKRVGKAGAGAAAKGKGRQGAKPDKQKE
eukprot:Filipodium_phascolosomae@DN6827_c0_g1_i1.p1